MPSSVASTKRKKASLARYDIIGDIHGEYDKLVGLLTKLGYELDNGVYRHPERAVIFVGDLIDRGPKQDAVYRLVRAMVEAGTARVVMGNHEFNAIAFATPNETTGDMVRPRTGDLGEKNRHQHRAFTDQVGMDSALHDEIVAWFRTLPLWIEEPELRVVHACWHQASIDLLADAGYNNGVFTPEMAIETGDETSPLFTAAEMILKGPEISLGELPGFADKDGHIRHNARLRWWRHDARTLREAAEIPVNAMDENTKPYPPLPDTPIAWISEYTYGLDERPVFFGHYWRKGTPELDAKNALCVDYSAVREGESLVAYRFTAGEDLDAKNFVRYPG